MGRFIEVVDYTIRPEKFLLDQDCINIIGLDPDQEGRHWIMLNNAGIWGSEADFKRILAAVSPQII